MNCPECGQPWTVHTTGGCPKWDQIAALTDENARLKAASQTNFDAALSAVAENARLKAALVECALPYEALRMDGESRKWIAPSIWKQIVEATEAARAALKARIAALEQEKQKGGA